MRTVRLPIAVGLASLQDLALGFLLVPIGVSIFIFDFVYLDLTGFGYALGAMGLFAGVGWIRMKRAWKYRPSDAVFTEDALRIEGGPNSGFEVPWKQLALDTCKVHEIDSAKIEQGKRWTLRVQNRELAESDDEREAVSFRELIGAMHARVKKAPEAEDARDAKIFACTSCGAPIAPADSATTKCGHCGTDNAVPEETRDRVRAASTVTAQSTRAERLVVKVLDQPGATSTSVLLWVSFAIIGGAWPFTVWAYAHLSARHPLSTLHAFGLGLLPFLLIADGFFLSRLRLVDRRALGTLATAFAARPPAREGEPLRCRSCFGPLPIARSVVVKCVHCGASNVTGLDLRGEAARAESSALSLEDALAERDRERAVWRLRTLLSIPLFVVAGILIYGIIRG